MAGYGGSDVRTGEGPIQTETSPHRDPHPHTSVSSAPQGLPGSLPWGMFMTFLNDYFQQQYGISAGVSWGAAFRNLVRAPN